MNGFGHNGAVHLAVFSLAGLVVVTCVLVCLSRAGDDPKFEGKHLASSCSEGRLTIGNAQPSLRDSRVLVAPPKVETLVITHIY